MKINKINKVNKVNKNTSYQNIKYCRYIYLWALLYLFNVVNFSPCFSLLVIVLFEIYSHISKNNKIKNFSSKFLYIMLVDIFLLLLIFIKSKKLFFSENVLFFIYFNIILIVYYKTNIVVLNINIKNDDQLYKNENYFNYLKRVYNLNYIEYFSITSGGLIIIAFINFIISKIYYLFSKLLSIFNN